MISALFLIAGIHSTTNLKTYELAKYFFPAKRRSSSEESLEKKHETFIGMCSVSHTKFISRRSRIYNHIKYLKMELFAKIVNG